MTSRERPVADYGALRRAQDAVRIAKEGGAPRTHSLRPAPPAPPAPKDRPVHLDEAGRAAAIDRTIALLSTVTDYYGITVTELEQEKRRIRDLTDAELMRTLRAYEFASEGVQLMLDDERAREAAIRTDPETAAFYGSHGASAEDLASSRPVAPLQATPDPAIRRRRPPARR